MACHGVRLILGEHPTFASSVVHAQAHPPIAVLFVGGAQGTIRQVLWEIEIEHSIHQPGVRVSSTAPGLWGHLFPPLSWLARQATSMNITPRLARWPGSVNG